MLRAAAGLPAGHEALVRRYRRAEQVASLMSADDIISALDLDWSDGYSQRGENVRMDPIRGHEHGLKRAIETILSLALGTLGVLHSDTRCKRLRDVR